MAIRFGSGEFVRSMAWKLLVCRLLIISKHPQLKIRVHDDFGQHIIDFPLVDIGICTLEKERKRREKKTTDRNFNYDLVSLSTSRLLRDMSWIDLRNGEMRSSGALVYKECPALGKDPKESASPHLQPALMGYTM